MYTLLTSGHLFLLKRCAGKHGCQWVRILLLPHHFAMQPSDDISALYQRFDGEASTYREIQRDAEVQAAMERWPQALLTQKHNFAPAPTVEHQERWGQPHPHQASTWDSGPHALPSHIVALTSAQGGTGVTSVAAYLGAACKRKSSAPVVVLDLSARNLLATYAGAPVHSCAGLARSSLAGQAWRDVAQQTSQGVHVIAQGALLDEDRIALDAHISAHPQWLAQNLAALQLPVGSLVLLDVGSTPSNSMRQALRLAHAVVAVHTPDTSSLMVWPALERLIDTHCSHRSTFIGCLHALNHVHMAAGLTKDVARIMRHQWQDASVVTIHRDEAMREAVAQQIDIASCAPHSQAARDINVLAHALLQQLTQSAGIAKVAP